MLFSFAAVEAMSFERPLVTDLNVSRQSFNGIKHGWTSAHNEEDSMEVSCCNLNSNSIIFKSIFKELNTALDEALEDYDLATRWLDSKARQQEPVESKK